MNANPDAELLALEGNLIDECTAFEAKRGKTDDEVDEWTNRMDVMERQFAEMPVHTLDGVAAKLRRLHYSKHEGGEALPETVLVNTAFVGLEHIMCANPLNDLMRLST